MSQTTNDYVIKIILIGDGGIGKTCLVNRFVYNRFTMDTSMTIGVNFNVLTFKGTSKGNPIQLTMSIWDLGGQEKFYSMIPYFIEGATAVVYAFDLSDSKGKSLQNLTEKWRAIIQSHLLTEIPTILVGTKADIASQRQNKIDPAIIKDAQKEIGSIAYVETSAKDNLNCEQVFLRLGQEVFNRPIHKKKDIKILERIPMETD
jgi:small GTP-binding protein